MKIRRSISSSSCLLELALPAVDRGRTNPFASSHRRPGIDVTKLVGRGAAICQVRSRGTDASCATEGDQVPGFDRPPYYVALVLVTLVSQFLVQEPLHVIRWPCAAMRCRPHGCPLPSQLGCFYSTMRRNLVIGFHTLQGGAGVDVVVRSKIR